MSLWSDFDGLILEDVFLENVVSDDNRHFLEKKQLQNLSPSTFIGGGLRINLTCEAEMK